MGTRVVSEEGSFKNANGQTIFTKCWRPGDNKLGALVFIAHGFGEHCSRYERLGTALAEQGYLVFTQDHIGHGKSEGERAQVSDIAHYMRDVFKHIDQVVADNTEKPIFMFGHSMGGAVAIMSVMERPNFFTGAVFSSPSVQANPKLATPCKTCLGKIVAWIAPSYQVIPPIDPSLLSRDPVQVEKYANDPLVWHEGMKARFVVAMLDAMDGIQKNVSKVTAPFLLIHGDDDQVVPIEGSHFLHEHSPSTDKTFKVFENGRHEILKEVEEMASEAHKDILDWIQQKLS